jgi:hypothetical protein
MQALDRYISLYQMPSHPPFNLLICEVPCSLFKDCFRTRVYCLVLLVVARLVLLIRGSPLERGPVTITTCPGEMGICISHPLNRFRCFRVTSLWPRWCCPEMDAWRDVWHLARARLRDMDAGDGSECSSSSAAVREGLGRTVARRPALGSSQMSRTVHERRVERLLWRIVGRKRKLIGEEQSVCLIGTVSSRFGSPL